jgi:hypothetical protein
MKTINGITFCDDYDKYEITEEDIEIMKIRFCFAMEEQNIYGIWHNHLSNPEKSEEHLEKVLQLTDLEEPEPGKTRAKVLLDRFNNYSKDFNYSHGGDCTNEPYSCSRCYMERLLEIDTRMKNKEFYLDENGIKRLINDEN